MDMFVKDMKYVVEAFLGLSTTMETALLVAMIGAIALVFAVIYLRLAAKHKRDSMDATSADGGWQPLGTSAQQPQNNWNQPMPVPQSVMQQMMMQQQSQSPTTTAGNTNRPPVPQYANSMPNLPPMQQMPANYQQSYPPQQGFRDAMPSQSIPSFAINVNRPVPMPQAPQSSFSPFVNAGMSQYPQQLQQPTQPNPPWMNNIGNGTFPPQAAMQPMPLASPPSDFNSIPPTLSAAPSSPPQWIQDNPPSWSQSAPSSTEGLSFAPAQSPSIFQQSNLNSGNHGVQNQPFMPNGMSMPVMNETMGMRVEEGKEWPVYEVRKPMLTIGRSRESDIFLEDLAVSRLHATIVQTAPNAYALKDEGSANGTKVNGMVVDKYQTRSLQPGDRVQVGNNTTFLFTRV